MLGLLGITLVEIAASLGMYQNEAALKRRALLRMGKQPGYKVPGLHQALSMVSKPRQPNRTEKLLTKHGLSLFRWLANSDTAELAVKTVIINNPPLKLLNRPSYSKVRVLSM